MIDTNQPEEQPTDTVGIRKLASIRQIKDIRPIEGADAIELVIVDGWQCVAKKGEFKLNDKCVYFEIDSFLPVRPEFEFLRKGCFKNTTWGGEGFRIRTIKLRGQLSQGLVLPISEDLRTDIGYSELHNEGREPRVGDDITELLGVKKWDPPLPACLQGMARGNFPPFIQKTDQERIQNCWDDVKLLYGDLVFEITVKLDGSSCSVYHNNGNVGVCSRNLDLKLEGNENNSFVKFATESGLLDGLKVIGDNIAIQGELMGPGIQGNREQLAVHDLFVFDIYLIDAGRHATPDERKTLLDKLESEAGVALKQVPFVGEFTLEQFTSIEDILKFAEGPSLTNPVCEGKVFKSTVVVNGRVPSFKAISNLFLLKEKD
jgi:RNA ligase (TIGR02306 family)